jgi:hypothetical protein
MKRRTHEGETRTHLGTGYLMKGVTKGLWSSSNIRSTHFILVRLTGIQIELETYELHQEIEG